MLRLGSGCLSSIVSHLRLRWWLAPRTKLERELPLLFHGEKGKMHLSTSRPGNVAYDKWQPRH